MLMEVIDIFDQSILHRCSTSNIIPDRKVLDELAQPDASGVRANRNVELLCEQIHRQNLIHSAQPARINQHRRTSSSRSRPTLIFKCANPSASASRHSRRSFSSSYPSHPAEVVYAGYPSRIISRSRWAFDS